MKPNQYLEPPFAISPPLAQLAGDSLYEVVVAERNIAVLKATIRRKEEWLERWRNKPATTHVYRRVEDLKEDLEELKEELILNETRLSIAYEVHERRRGEERKVS